MLTYSVFKKKIFENQIIAGSFWLLLSAMLLKFSTLFISFYSAHILGIKDYGITETIFSIMTVLMMPMNMGMNIALTKFIPEFIQKNIKKVKSLILTALLLNFIISSFLFPIYIIFLASKFTLYYKIENYIMLFYIGMAGLLFQVLFNTGQGIMIGFKQFKPLAIRSIFVISVSIFLTVILINKLNIEGAILAWVMTAFLNFLFLLPFVIQILNQDKYGRWEIDLSLLKQLFAFCGPKLLGSLAVEPMLWISNTIIYYYHGFSGVGIFMICYNITQITLFVPMTSALPLRPIFAELLINNKRESLKKTLANALKAGLMLSVTGIGVVSFLSFYLFPIIYKENFSSYYSILFTMQMSVIFITLSGIMGFLIVAAGKVWLGFVLNFIWLSVYTLVLSFSSRFFNIISVSISLQMSYLLQMILSFFILKKFLKLHINIWLELIISYITLTLIYVSFYFTGNMFAFSTLLMLGIFVIIFYQYFMTEYHNLFQATS